MRLTMTVSPHSLQFNRQPMHESRMMFKGNIILPECQSGRVIDKENWSPLFLITLLGTRSFWQDEPWQQHRNTARIGFILWKAGTQDPLFVLGAANL